VSPLPLPPISYPTLVGLIGTYYLGWMGGGICHEGGSSIALTIRAIRATMGYRILGPRGGTQGGVGLARAISWLVVGVWLGWPHEGQEKKVAHQGAALP
jgi:hypothetical protein